MLFLYFSVTVYCNQKTKKREEHHINEYNFQDIMYCGHVTYTPSEDATTEYTDDLDEIEFISTQIIHLEPPLTPVHITRTIQTKVEEKKRRRVNRIVGFFAALIFLTCIVLVCSTMMMSKNIDELGRYNINN